MRVRNSQRSRVYEAERVTHRTMLAQNEKGGEDFIRATIATVLDSAWHQKNFPHDHDQHQSSPSAHSSDALPARGRVPHGRGQQVGSAP